MRSLFRALCAAFAFCAVIASGHADTGGKAPPVSIESLAEDLRALMIRHETAPLALSYVDNLRALPDRPSLLAAKASFSDFKEKLEDVDRNGLPLCDRLDLDRMSYMVDIAVSRAALGAGFRDGDNADIPDGGIAHVRNGKAWYRHFLHAWLGDAAEPDALFRMGMDQLAAANRRYEASGESAGEASPTPADAPQDIDEDAIRAAYEERWSTVESNLGRLFHGDYGVPPVLIARSPLGDELPTAGYYVADEQTFYYNAFQGAYDLSQTDWIFLHEALPGHHFAIQAARLNNPCQTRFPDLAMYAYIEGWGAYVETLGRPLGLYREPAYQRSALEWDMVRSARIALDVGINYHGWTDEQALAFWDREVSGARHFAEREISRMRRWPAQAITYKYGAAVFTQTRNRLEAAYGEDFDIRDFHDAALRYGDMPLSSFEDLIKSKMANPDQSSGDGRRPGENP